MHNRGFTSFLHNQGWDTIISVKFVLTCSELSKHPQQHVMPPDTHLLEITVEALAQRIAEADTPLQLIDVREPQEIAIAALPNFQVFPLSQSSEWMETLPTQLDPHCETYVMCHHGMRSAQMCQWLTQQGFTNVKNIVGGIDAYSVGVDSSIPRY
jgi:rhodanese-related sulfurtransferase